MSRAANAAVRMIRVTMGCPSTRREPDVGNFSLPPRTSQEQNSNGTGSWLGGAPKSPAMLAKRSATGAWAARRPMSCRGARLRARRDAFRVVGPVAVDADHAPLHAPLPTDHAAVF